LIHHLMYTDITSIPPGYPTVAGLISKDDDFAIFRKFRYLNARNLLYLQAELIHLENELETLDRGLDTEQHREKLKDWRAFAEDNVRLELAVRIRKTLQEYSKKRAIVLSCTEYGVHYAHLAARWSVITTWPSGESEKPSRRIRQHLSSLDGGHAAHQ
jgi:hypothetical protein